MLVLLVLLVFSDLIPIVAHTHYKGITHTPTHTNTDSEKRKLSYLNFQTSYTQVSMININALPYPIVESKEKPDLAPILIELWHYCRPFFSDVKIWPFSETRKHWYLSFTTTYSQESTIKKLHRTHALAISLIYLKLEAILIELCHFSYSFFHPKLPQSLDLGFLRNQSSDCTISRRFGTLFAWAFDISPAF